MKDERVVCMQADPGDKMGKNITAGEFYRDLVDILQ